MDGTAETFAEGGPGGGADGDGGVSFRGRRWRVAEADPDRVRGVVRAGAPAAAAPVLAARGIDPGDVPGYLRPTLRERMPDPFSFRGVAAAVDRIERAVRSGEDVLVWGDYDVDGATSAAILVRYLRAAGLEARVHVPDRVSEGYGPNAEGLRAYAAEGVTLACVLDAGTVAFEPFRAAREAGIDAVVVDHHAAEEELPDVEAVVNPNRTDEDGSFGHLCAAGMTFLVVVALNAQLRDGGFFGDGGPPDLMSMLDLVALGTVADVVPLEGFNRAFVARGLRFMARRGNPGIAALLDVAGVRGEPNAHTCGFLLGPRVNAGGRVGDAGTGARLLSCDDPATCRELAEELDARNRERREIERTCVEGAREQVEPDPGAATRPALVVLGDGWHEGVVGIAAGRLKERYDRPAFVFTRVGDGLAKGSARSMPGFDVGACVMEARRRGLLVKAGGHEMAAGATVRVEDLDAFREFLDGRVRASRFFAEGPVSEADAAIDGGQVAAGLADALDVMKPFGVGNARPRFVVRDVRLRSADVLRDGEGNPTHLRAWFAGATGAPVKAMAFRQAETPLAEGVLASVGGRLDLLGTVEVNEWRGRREGQLILEDARPAADAGEG